MLDFIYDWIMYIVPNWLWWVLMTPLFMLRGLILILYLVPGTFVDNGS